MSRLSSLNNHYGNNNTKICFVYKKKNYQSTKHTKKECDEVREGFKRYIYQYLADNNIDNNFNKDITAIALNILTLTTTSGNFFYNNYGVKHFITLHGPIPIKTAKNIVIFINNNAFIYGLTGNTKPGGIKPSSTEPSTVRSNNKGKSTIYFCNNNNDNINIENLTVDINFLNCHFNNDGQDLALPPIFPYSL